MTLVIVPMGVKTDTGDLLVIFNVLQIVKTVTAKLDNLSAVSLVIGRTLVIYPIYIYIYAIIYNVIVLHISYLVLTGEKLKDSNLKILFILYGVIAALSISLIVNGYMIIWYV